MSKRRRSCRFCGEPVKYQPVLVGTRHRRKLVVLTVDADPHADGRVIVNASGERRLLVPWEIMPAGVKTYRVHSQRECEQKESVHDGSLLR